MYGKDYCRIAKDDLKLQIKTRRITRIILPVGHFCDVER